MATTPQQSKFEELTSGTFHEIADQIRFIEVGHVAELLQKKRDYAEMEGALGIVKR